MESMEWSLPAAFEVVGAAAPDRAMLVWKNTRRTYAEVAARTRSLASFLQRHGIGVCRERHELERWECGQATVALLLYNCPEYIEAMLGCFRARAVPFNVNQHYRPEEVRGLLDMLDAEAVIYHRALAPLVAEATKGRQLLLVDVDDGSGVAPLAGSTSFADAASEPVAADLSTPSPDDLCLVCTGGTTGSPKAVLWRQGDIFVAAMGGTEDTTRGSLTAKAASGGGAWFAAPPLMHAAAQWTAFAGIHSGGTIVLHDDAAPFDARTILETVARERVTMMSIVGDAFARPLLAELRRTPYDLASLQMIGTGGAVTSAAVKQQLLELLPHVAIVDGYGASETGGMPTVRRDAPGCRAASHLRPVPRCCRLTGVASSRQATTRSAGPHGAVAYRSGISATARRPRRPSRSSTASASPFPAIGRVCRPTEPSPCSAATRW